MFMSEAGGVFWNLQIISRFGRRFFPDDSDKHRCSGFHTSCTANISHAQLVRV